MYSTHNEEKFVIAGRFIRTLKIKFINIDDIVNKYNNTHHSTIKMKLVGVKSSTYILTLIKKLMKKL